MSDELIIQEARDFLKRSADVEGRNRTDGLEDLKFAAGEQWPAEIQNSRSLEARPCLTINKVDPYIRSVTNQQRQQRPRMRVHAANNQAQKKIADIITGICRHIEVNSDADQAYDTAFNYVARMGWGYWRVRYDYESYDSFEQEIYIDQIQNPFTVYFDHESVLPDGSDAKKCIISEMIDRKEYEKLYPDSSMVGFEYRGTGDDMADWITKDGIRVVEYFKIEDKPSKLCLLSDKSSRFKDDLPSDEVMKLAGLEILEQRDSFKRVVKWYKMNAVEILDENEIIGKYIPVIPVYGDSIIIDGKHRRYGLVRFAKDPQRIYNFEKTSFVESVALAPKAKWIMAEGQDEGHENEWAQANIKAMSYLRYKQTDVDGQPAPPPIRQNPEPPPTGIMEAMQSSNSDLQSVMGIIDPAMRIAGNISGKALQSERSQSDQSTFHYYDNLTRSIRHTGKIILGWIPKIYDTQRVMRIIGDDGKPDLVTLNDKTAIDRIENDVTIGEYDIVMDTGPGYNTKRQEAVDSMLGLVQSDPDVLKIAGDLIFRNMDFPGAEVIADRLAASNPLAMIDEKSDIPPAAQMKLQQMQQQLQQMQQQLQSAGMEIKHKAGIEQMREANKLSIAKMNNERAVHDVTTRAITAQNTEEIKAIAQLILHHMDTARLDKQIDKDNTEQAIAGARAEQSVNQR